MRDSGSIRSDVGSSGPAIAQKCFIQFDTDVQTKNERLLLYKICNITNKQENSIDINRIIIMTIIIIIMCVLKVQ